LQVGSTEKKKIFHFNEILSLPSELNMDSKSNTWFVEERIDFLGGNYKFIFGQLSKG